MAPPSTGGTTFHQKFFFNFVNATDTDCYVNALFDQRDSQTGYYNPSRKHIASTSPLVARLAMGAWTCDDNKDRD